MNRNLSRKGSTSALFLILMALAASVLLFAGCASKQPESPDMAEKLAEEAMHDFNHGDYYSARETFQKIKDQYPFSSQGLLAELKIADSDYYLKNYDEALTQYEEFEQNHPTNEAIPYVLFQIGMSHFKKIDSIDRDTSGASNAIKAFSRLLKTFPNSPYNEEAQIKIAYAKNFLARHELYVAKFYARTKEFKQAEGRLKYLLDTYPDAKVVGKARELLAEVRKKMAEKESKK